MPELIVEERDGECTTCREPAAHVCPECGYGFCDELWTKLFLVAGCPRCVIEGWPIERRRERAAELIATVT